MSTQPIHILSGCIACGACAEICPEVFEIRGTSVILANADFDFFRDWIHQAEEFCPVDVIRLGE